MHTFYVVILYPRHGRISMAVVESAAIAAETAAQSTYGTFAEGTAASIGDALTQIRQWFSLT